MRTPFGWILVALLFAAFAAPLPASRPAKPQAPAPAAGPEVEAGINWNPPEDRVVTLHDFETVNVRSALEQFRDRNRDLIGGVVPRKVSVADALAAARSAIDPSGKGALLAALRARPELQTTDALRAYAAAAFISAKPGVALAALLVAEERQAREAATRFNLASLLAWHGMVNEADALLDDLVAAGGAPPQSFGITPAQAVNYLRAYVQMRQGKTAEATATLKPIAAANPYFSEALLTLALLEAEAGQDARQHFLMGVYRRPVPASAAQATGETGQATNASGGEPAAEAGDEEFGLDASLMVDLSKGIAGSLPGVPTPKALPERLAYVDWAQAQTPVLTREAMDLGQRRDEARSRWSSKNLSEDLRDRLVAIERMLDPDNARLAEIRQLNRAIDRAIQDKTETVERLNQKFITTWAGLMPAYIKDPASVATQVKELADACDETMRAQVQLVDEYTRRRARIWHRYATALGALTGDRDFRAYLEAQIKLQEQAEYAGLVANMTESCVFARQAYMLARRCFEPPAKMTDGLEKGGDAKTAECSEDAAKNSMGIEAETSAGVGKLTDISVSAEATCDGLSFEVSGKLGDTLGLSAEFEVKTDKTCTFYLGPKLTIPTSMPGAGTSTELSSKAGVYLTMDQHSFTDAGFKTNVKETVKYGALGVNVTASRTLPPPTNFFPGPQAPEVGRSGLAEFHYQPR